MKAILVGALPGLFILYSFSGYCLTAPPTGAPNAMRLCLDGVCQNLTWANDHYEGVKDGESSPTTNYTVTRWQADGIELSGVSVKRFERTPFHVTGVFTGRPAPEGGSIADAKVAWHIGMKSGNASFQLTWQPAALSPNTQAAVPSASNGGPVLLRIVECEAKVCSPAGPGSATWTFTDVRGVGQFGTGQQPMTIEHIDHDSIAVRRKDTSRAATGLTALYMGKIDGQSIIGTVIYYDAQHPGVPSAGAWYGSLVGSPENMRTLVQKKEVSGPAMPLTIRECEGSSCNTGAFPIIWMFSGLVGKGWVGMGERPMRIEHLDSGLVMVRRMESSMTALYIGQIDGNRITGGVLYYAASHPTVPDIGTWLGVMGDAPPPGSIVAQNSQGNPAAASALPMPSAPKIINGEIPLKWRVCEDVAGCTIWNFQNGVGRGVYKNGTVADLKVEQFDDSAVSLTRADKTGTQQGLQAVYSGVRKGNHVDGSVSLPGGQTRHWSATLAFVPPGYIAPKAPMTTVSVNPRYDLNGTWRIEMDHTRHVGIEIELEHTANDVRMILTEQSGQEGVTLFIGRQVSKSLLSGWQYVSNDNPKDLRFEWQKKDLEIEDPDHIKMFGGEIARWAGITADDAKCDMDNSSHTRPQWAFMRGKEALEVQKSPSKAYCWFHASAAQGDPSAEAMVAGMLHEGSGVSKNLPEAFTWAKKSADQNNYSGLRMLSLMYKLGDGTPADPQKAQALRAQADSQMQQQRSLTDEEKLKTLATTPNQFGLSAADLVGAFFSAGNALSLKERCEVGDRNSTSEEECKKAGYSYSPDKAAEQERKKKQAQ